MSYQSFKPVERRYWGQLWQAVLGKPGALSFPRLSLDHDFDVEFIMPTGEDMDLMTHGLSEKIDELILSLGTPLDESLPIVAAGPIKPPKPTALDEMGVTSPAEHRFDWYCRSCGESWVGKVQFCSYCESSDVISCQWIG